MNTTSLRLLAAALAVLLTSIPFARAQGPIMSIVALGSLGGPSCGNSQVPNIRADGSTMVSISSPPPGQGGGRGFGWTAALGMLNLDLLAGGASAAAFAVSDDATTVVGNCDLVGSSHEAILGSSSSTDKQGLGDELMKLSRATAEEYDETELLFGEGVYRARSWKAERRIVFKAEVLHYRGRKLKDNDRYVMTNRTRMQPDNLYAWYCGRGDSENRIKELMHDLSIDRTSCSSFVANQFRVLMTAAAFVLFQELRWRLRRTRAARSTAGKLRDMLLKVATRVVTCCRRIVCHFPHHMPWADVWQTAARECGARLA